MGDFGKAAGERRPNQGKEPVNLFFCELNRLKGSACGLREETRTLGIGAGLAAGYPESRYWVQVVPDRASQHYKLSEPAIHQWHYLGILYEKKIKVVEQIQASPTCLPTEVYTPAAAAT